MSYSKELQEQYKQIHEARIKNPPKGPDSTSKEDIKKAVELVKLQNTLVNIETHCRKITKKRFDKNDDWDAAWTGGEMAVASKILKLMGKKV